MNQEIEKLKEKYQVTPPSSEIASLIADIKATKVDASKNIVHLRPDDHGPYLPHDLKTAELKAAATAPTAPVPEAVPVVRMATNPLREEGLFYEVNTDVFDN